MIVKTTTITTKKISYGKENGIHIVVHFWSQLSFECIDSEFLDKFYGLLPMNHLTEQKYLKRFFEEVGQPLTLLDHEVSGRASLLNGHLVPHQIVSGSNASISPDLVQFTSSAVAHYYFHTHPVEHLSLLSPLSGCWPSAEDLCATITLMGHNSEPPFRELVVTPCGIVVLRRDGSTFSDVRRYYIARPVDWQWDLYCELTGHLKQEVTTNGRCTSRKWDRETLRQCVFNYGFQIDFLVIVQNEKEN